MLIYSSILEPYYNFFLLTIYFCTIFLSLSLLTVAVLCLCTSKCLYLSVKFSTLFFLLYASSYFPYLLTFLLCIFLEHTCWFIVICVVAFAFSPLMFIALYLFSSWMLLFMLQFVLLLIIWCFTYWSKWFNTYRKCRSFIRIIRMS